MKRSGGFPRFFFCGMMGSMKRMVCFFAAVLLLATAAAAAQVGMVVASDGQLCSECELGDLGADALRSYTGADIALFASGDLGIGLQPGEADETAIARSFPNDAPVVVAELDEAALRSLLEQSVAAIVLDENERIDAEGSASADFLCVAGFSFSYDASAPVGGRLYDLELDFSGGTVTAALPARYAEGEQVCTIREAVTAYLEAQDTVQPPEGGRIRALGANDNPIIGGVFPKSFVLVVAVVAVAFGGARWRSQMRKRTER